MTLSFDLCYFSVSSTNYSIRRQPAAVSSEVTSESRSMQASKFTVKTLSRVITKPTSSSESPATRPSGRLRELTKELRQLEEKLRLGGGQDKIDKQHKQGKLTARERIDRLFDRDSYR